MARIKIEKPSEQERKKLGIPDTPQNTAQWSIWECAPSAFDWQYSDEEIAYIYEGKVRVRTDQGEIEINRGDLVTFPKGLKCRWQVLEPVKKVYQFR
ncbi:MAG: cupin domain-containing protein [Candidatus Omnitrophota bacterium]